MPRNTPPNGKKHKKRRIFVSDLQKESLKKIIHSDFFFDFVKYTQNDFKYSKNNHQICNNSKIDDTPKNFIMITLGTGVGSGIVINGDVVYGHDGFAGELGHTTAVRYNGRLCNCGRTGCLETYASAIGVARTAKEWLESSDEPSILRGISDNITSKDVYEAASQGDKMAIRIFEFTGKKLGESFAEFVAFSAPQAIILFGGLSRAGDMILKPIVEHMNANLLHLWKNKIDVFFSQLKESDAAILGASALGWEIK